MATKRTEVAVKSLISFLYYTTSITAENVISIALHQQTQNHLTAAENAPLDFGLLAGTHNLPRAGVASRLFHAVREYPDNQVIGLDFKTFIPWRHTGLPNEAMAVRFEVRAGQQRHATAVLLYTIASPRDIAIVPLWLYDYWFDYDSVTNIELPLGSSYHCRAVEYAPVPWDFCVMPWAYLGKNMDTILDFFHGQRDSW